MIINEILKIFNSTTTAKSMTDMPAGMPFWRAGWTLEKEREKNGIQYDLFGGFLTGLSETEELPVDFNEKLFHRLVDYATVYSDGRVVFTFRNGAEISTKI